MRNIQQNPKTLVFEPFTLFSAERMAGVSPRTLDLLKSKQPSGATLATDILHGMHPSLLGKSLDQMNERMIRLLRPFIDELGTVGTVDLYEWTRHSITIASTDSSYGDMNPYKDRKAENAFWFVLYDLCTACSMLIQ